MKNKKIIPGVVVTMLVVLMSLMATDSFAQGMGRHHKKMKECCMMKDGKMMCMKDGMAMPMDKAMTMKNGTKCMPNGECIMKDGTKMQMKGGQCMDKKGRMHDDCMMHSGMKGSADKEMDKKEMTYSCPMHPEVKSNTAGKCPKCGMDLVKKK